MHIALGATLAYSIAGSGTDALTSGLNDLARVCIVVGSFPAAMLIMAGTLGLRQARMRSNGAFAAGVAAVVLVLLGGATWANDGVGSPDDAYSRIVLPTIAVVWISIVSGLLYLCTPAARQVSEAAGFPGVRDVMA